MNTPALALPAPLWRRLMTAVYDGLLVVAICMSVAVLVTPATAFIGVSGRGALQALMVLAVWFYFTMSWTRGGQTLGMRVWRVRLRRADSDTPVTLTQATARFFVMLILCMLPTVVGVFASFRDPEHAPAWLLLLLLPAFCMLLALLASRRALHDLIAGGEMVLTPPLKARASDP